MSLTSHMRSILINQDAVAKRYLHVSAILNRRQSAHYKPKPKVLQSLTYEMANPPFYIAARKSWNSWNTSNIQGGNRPSETALEDMFVRNFLYGTWHGLFASEVIIKRQHNLIRIAGIITRHAHPHKVYFLLGYTENLLSRWLHCQVKMELVTIENKNEMIYKVI